MRGGSAEGEMAVETVMDSTQVVRGSIGDHPRAGPKRRTRVGPLSKVDKRTVAGKRVGELKRLFASELTSAGLEITPMRQLKIDAAAQAVALAETARSRFLREGQGDVADLVAVQRSADAAVRRIGLPPDKPVAQRPDDLSLRDRLATKYGASP